MEPSILDPNDWIDTADLAVILGKAVSTLEGARSAGRDHPPYYKTGGVVRYRRSEVEAWLKSRRRLTAACQLRDAALA